MTQTNIIMDTQNRSWSTAGLQGANPDLREGRLVLGVRPAPRMRLPRHEKGRDGRPKGGTPNTVFKMAAPPPPSLRQKGF